MSPPQPWNQGVVRARTTRPRWWVLAALGCGSGVIPLKAQGQIAGAVSSEATMAPRPSARAFASIAFETEGEYVTQLSSMDRLVVHPFLRVDFADPGGGRVDLQELTWTRTWPGYDLSVGVHEVFWGTAEAQRVVDVVNQTVPVLTATGRVKLGQPAVLARFRGSWGALEILFLPLFRPRPFDGPGGRLWSPLPVVSDGGAPRLTTDAAVRWSRSFAGWDIGVSHFVGLARDPAFRHEALDSGPGWLVPEYGRVHQAGVDTQGTLARWVWKVEAIVRWGWDSDFWRAGGGLEYAMTDYLALFAEYGFDARGRAGDTSFENDLFVGARVVSHVATLRAGAYLDHRSSNVIVNATLLYRLTSELTLTVGGGVHLGDAALEPPHAFRQGGVLTVRLTRFF